MPETQDQTLGLEFYGKNYLGRPVSVAVQGESPVGAASSGMAAVPSGGLGGGASPAGGPRPSPTSPSSTTLQTIQRALQALQAGRLLFDVGDKGVQVAQKAQGPSDPGSNQIPLAQSAGESGVATGAGVTADQTIPSIAAQSSPGLTASGFQMGTFPEVSGAEANTIAGSGTAGGTAATTGGETAAEGAASVPFGIAAGGGSLAFLASQQIPPGPRHQSELGLSAVNAPTAGLLAVPDIINTLRSGGNFGSFFGKSPAMAFPKSAWSSLSSQVNRALPPQLPVPSNATPEQKQAIEAANKTIKGLDKYRGGMPESFGGRQSSKAWQDAIASVQHELQTGFGELQTSYPAAYRAFLESQQKVPAGAPQGLFEALSGPANKLQQAMSTGDFVTAREVLATYPNDAQVQALMQQYAPQIQAGQSQSQGFLRGDKLPQGTQ